MSIFARFTRPDRKDPLGFFGRDLSLAFLGHFFAKGLGILTFWRVTNVLTTAEYGLFSLASSVGEIALYLSELGLSIGTTRFTSKGIRNQDERATDRILQAVFLAKLATGAIVFVAGYFAAPLIATRLLDQESMTPHLRIALAGIFGMHLYSFYQAYFSARLEFGKNALFGLLTPIGILVAVYVSWWRERLDVLTCLKIYALVPLAVCALALLALPHKFLARETSGVGPLIEVWRFSRWVYLTNVLGTLRFRLNSILLARLTTLHEVGLYNYGDKLAATLTLLTDTVLTVFVPRASHLVTRDELQRLLRRSYKAVLVVVPAMAVVPFLARPLIRFLAPAYIDAAPLFSILFASVVFSLVALPSRTVLYSIHRARTETAIEALALVLTLALSTVLVRTHGVVGAAIAMLIQRIVSAALTIAAVHRAVFHETDADLAAGVSS